ncbi:MAG: Fe-S cluster assembly sulfur transfer protein SufU [Ethanoligenens sp.]|uniref:Fe-S cluster assembly sulfur transfer protein SufU n=1 Tax=Ethanoligenens sp. TaxID=2099655 RepID=UPI0039EBEF4F
MDLNNIYTEIITEHNASPANKRHIENPTAVLKGHNPSCGDEIELELRVKDGFIEDASFTGIGCAISQASADIMVDLIKGKSVDEAKKLAQTFLGMIKHEITDDEQLEVLDEAVALKNIGNMPARVKCAVLGWHTLENAMDGKKD